MVIGQSLFQRVGNILVRLKLTSAMHAVGQFHHVEKRPRGVVATDVQDVNQPVMCPRDGRVLEQAAILALEGRLVGEPIAPNQLDRVKIPKLIQAEPDLAVGAVANLPQQLVSGGDVGIRGGRWPGGILGISTGIASLQGRFGRRRRFSLAGAKADPAQKPGKWIGR